MALQRSFESHEPPRRRLFTDPFAGAFLRRSWRALAVASGIPAMRPLAFALYDSIGGPGPRPSAIVRTRVIDDALSELMSSHGQCVILGAGYDTRAHRLEALRSKRVYEVDHPATQDAKRSIVRKLGLETEHVTYVPVDFEHDSLFDRLLDSGYRRESPSVVLWEGVTQYLTRGAVESTLGVIRSLAASSGGHLIATYVDERALELPSPFPEAARWVRAVARVGEPWIFGINPEKTRQFFFERGYTVQRDVSMLDASRELMAGRSQRHRGSALYRVVVATTSCPDAGHSELTAQSR